MLSLLIEARGGMRQGERRKSRRVRVALGAVPAGDKGTLEKSRRMLGLEADMDTFEGVLGDPSTVWGQKNEGFLMSCAEECGEVR